MIINHAEKTIVILGSGDFAVDIADVISDTGGWNFAGFVQNKNPNSNTTLDGLPVYWIEDALSHHPGAWAICALGSQKRSRFIQQASKLGFKFATVTHPFTRVSTSAEIKQGTIVCPGAVIAAQTRLGEHVIVNRMSSIGHHVCIEDFAFIAPGVTICGSCLIGSRAFIGAGAVINDHISVGAGAFVAAGAVVTRDVGEGERVMGVPARPTT